MNDPNKFSPANELNPNPKFFKLSSGLTIQIAHIVAIASQYVLMITGKRFDISVDDYFELVYSIDVINREKFNGEET